MASAPASSNSFTTRTCSFWIAYIRAVNPFYIKNTQKLVSMFSKVNKYGCEYCVMSSRGSQKKVMILFSMHCYHLRISCCLNGNYNIHDGKCTIAIVGETLQVQWPRATYHQRLLTLRWEVAAQLMVIFCCRVWGARSTDSSLAILSNFSLLFIYGMCTDNEKQG